jgi:hypothetical protein
MSGESYTVNMHLILRPLVYALLTVPAAAAPEVFEVTPERLADLPQGKEADGIAGDFVMRNDKVELLISGNLPERRANMSTFYGADGQTPGCLYDLTLRGTKNDQITIFSPAGQRGPVSWVRIAKDGRDGAAEMETVTTAAANKGLYRRHTWRLRDGMQGIEIETTLRNESAAPMKITADDKMTQMTLNGQSGPYFWGNAVDPRDHAGYAVEPMRVDWELAPGQERSVTRFLAVGTSPAEALGVLMDKSGGAGKTTLTLLDERQQPVTTATVVVATYGKEVPAYPDRDGRLTITLPAGSHDLRITDAGRAPVKLSITHTAGSTDSRQVPLPAQSAVVFKISEEGSGRPMPCKVMFTARDGTAKVDLGPANRAHGCVDQWHSATGDFRVPLGAGSYRVSVNRGPEYAHHEQDVVLAAGQEVTVTAALKRMVDTTGWVSADFHNHSTPSGDNTCGTDDRLINMAAEHLEFTPTTEHNRLYDWAPHIQKLGLTPWMSTVTGMELTGNNQHLNCFPLTPEPGKQNNGAPVWNFDPRISAITLRDFQKPDPDRWVQVNHPDLHRVFNDRDADGNPDSGYDGIAQFVDSWEIENFDSEGLFGSAPFFIEQPNPGTPRRLTYNRSFIYLQLLNKGHRLRAVAVADAHSVHGNGTGGWRTWLPSSTDDPSKIDWREMSRAAKAGHIILSTGPFLRVTANGAPPGSEIKTSGQPVKLKVNVQANTWSGIDRVQVFVNSRQPAELNFTRQSHPDWFLDGVVQFDREIEVPLKEDAQIIVAVEHTKNALVPAFGTSPQAKLRPHAWHNPVYVDVNGDGWKPNGDTLGFDIPAARMTVEQAERILSILR